MRSTSVIIFSSLKSLTPKKLLKLTLLVFRHPLFSVLSFFATLKAFKLAKKYFPKTNSNNGIGNAFRHALWCCLIMKNCCKISAPKKAEKWCREFTEMHEELFPNESLERKMDLHNNEIGIQYFTKMLVGIHRQFFETQFFVDGLLDQIKVAKVLKTVDQTLDETLVYLEKLRPLRKNKI